MKKEVFSCDLCESETQQHHLFDVTLKVGKGDTYSFHACSNCWNAPYRSASGAKAILKRAYRKLMKKTVKL